MAKEKCKNCGHSKDVHAPKNVGGCAVIYKFYKDKDCKKNNPLNYKLKSCMCEEFANEWEQDLISMGTERRNDVLKEWRDYLEEFTKRFYSSGVHLIDLEHHRIKMRDLEKRFKKAYF